MSVCALQPQVTWAEDRALLRSTPSADPGAKTGAVAGVVSRYPRRTTATLHFPSIRDWHLSVKPSRHDAAIHPAGGLPLSLTKATEIPVPGEPGHCPASHGTGMTGRWG